MTCQVSLIGSLHYKTGPSLLKMKRKESSYGKERGKTPLKVSRLRESLMNRQLMWWQCLLIAGSTRAYMKRTMTWVCKFLVSQTRCSYPMPNPNLSRVSALPQVDHWNRVRITERHVTSRLPKTNAEWGLLLLVLFIGKRGSLASEQLRLRQVKGPSKI